MCNPTRPLNPVAKGLRVAQYEGARRALGMLLRRLVRPTPTNENEAALAFAALQEAEIPRRMLDAGAHHGGALRDFLRDGWQVFAFEPDQHNRQRLERRFGAYPELHIDPRALSNRPESHATFFSSAQSSGISGLSRFHSTHEAAGHVEVTTLSAFLDQNPVLRQGIGFLKIDTEGFDLMVLQGFPWAQLQPAMILCEFEDAKTRPLGYVFSDLADYVAAQGYDIIVSEWYPIESYGGHHRWRRFAPYPCTLADERAWGNLIASSVPDITRHLLHRCGLR